MNNFNVRIVNLEPKRVASVLGFGGSPEEQAWEKLVAWAGPKGLLEDIKQHPIFGFDNPKPSPGSPNYGYEFWITVGPEVEPEGEVKIQTFSGGLYAVAGCQGVENISPTWKQLVAWLDDSRYKHAHHQWLEQHLGYANDAPDGESLLMDLHMPISE